LKLFINEKGFAKLNIALAKGKKLFDKRESIKDRDNKRNLDRIKKNYKS
jgi:SsrA-binding protein